MRVTRLFSVLPPSFSAALRWLVGALAAFTAAGAVGWLWPPFAQIALGFLAAVVFGCLAIVVIAAGAGEAWRGRAKPLPAIGAALSPLLVVALGVGAALPCIRFGDGLVTWGWFLAHRRTYLEIAGRLERGEVQDQHGRDQTALGTKFVVEPNSKSQIAFPLSGGFVDNWRGIVHDPSGVVMKANEGRPEGGLGEVEMMFGGQMVWCRHMTGPFYECGFT